MPRFIPEGRRIARVLPLTLLGGLCLLFTACGGGSSGLKSAGGMAPQSEALNSENANTEAYGTIVENPYQSPLVAPALDVLGGGQHRVVLERPTVPHAGPTPAARRGLPRRTHQLLPLQLPRTQGR